MGSRLTQEEVQKRIADTFVQTVSLISEYKNKRSDITLRCEECGYEWTTKAQGILYTSAKQQRHQCPNCNIVNSKNGKYVRCSQCGKEIYRSKYQIKKNETGLFYCSRECGNRHKNLIRKINGEWNNSKNYRRKAFETFPHKCMVCGWDEDERILEVHHKDEDRNNNDIDNLSILCPTCHRKITLHYYKLLEDCTLKKL